MKTRKKQPVIPKLQYEISHIRQRYHWDCGIACILMLLPEDKRMDFIENFTQICQEEGFGQSTWTIDLAYLLKRFNIKHCMYTTRQAPNVKSLSKLDKNMILEAERVTMRFASAKFHGIKIFEGVLSIKELICYVLTTGPAIVLVNAALLSCDWCKRNKMASELWRIFGGTYRGHYILVVGWSGKLLYMDPARPAPPAAPLCATSAVRLDAARLVHGTDCDVILVKDDYR